MLKQYQRCGKVAYLDPIRAFLVEAKPEERVRQEFLQRLLNEYGVPESAIAVEYVLKKAGGRSMRRADVVLMGAGHCPLMVVECKEPGTPLHDGVLEQARSYAEELECAYIAITNGGEPEAFHHVDGVWRRIARFPAFEEMHSALQPLYEEPKSRDFEALTHEELEDLDFLEEHDNKLDEEWGYLVLGQDTSAHLRTPIYSLYNAIFHRPETDPYLPLEGGYFRVEEYLGLHFTEYGNYSGGTFPGLYASFRVTDARGDDQIYKIGFFASAHTENDPKYGNRKGTSGVHVAIDDFDRAPHMSLELSLDTCLKLHSTGFDVVHDGKITVGRLGAAKRELLINYVAEQAPHLVHGNSVVLGSFLSGEVLTFADVSVFVFNLLLYAELRDRFRADYKGRRP